MTLPIAMSRPAPDGNAPPANDHAPHTAERTVVFRRALASAMNGEAGSARAARERRTERPTDLPTERPVRAVGIEGERRQDLEGGAGDDNTLHAIGTPAEGQARHLSAELTVEARLALAGTLAAGEGSVSPETAEDSGAPEREGMEETFVAQSLEQVLTARTDAAPRGPDAQLAAQGVVPGVSPAAAPQAGEPDSPVPLARGTATTKVADAHDPKDSLRAAAAALLGRSRADDRNLEGLVPEMRTRLERVIERMESEYGFTVEVVETVRSQERQDALFAQGRSTPGPVVTWTRNSKHLDGRAADVVIDGGYDNAAGFERLARVAREEGLRTLWPRDPGHVELTAPSSANRTGQSATAGAPSIPHAARAGIEPQAGRVAPPLAPPNDAVRGALPDLPPLAVPAPAGARTAGVPVTRLEALERALAGRGPAPAGANGLEALAASTEAESSAVAAAGGESGIARVARVATVAPVADVARVARVARVAEVAVPGQSAAPTAPGAPGTLMPGQVIAAQGAPAGSGASTGDRGSSRERGGDGREARDDRGVHALPISARPGEGERTPMEMAREILASTGPRGEAGERDASPVAGLARSDATERIARVLRLQEAGSERPLSSVLLRLDNPEGGEDRIRIDMRGRTIGATLDVADARAAEQLRAHVPELQEALQRQGLEGEGLIVRSASRNSDVATLTASAAPAERDLARAASATASDGGGSTARDSRNPPRGSHEREGTDQQRSRQRRDGKEGRQ